MKKIFAVIFALGIGFGSVSAVAEDDYAGTRLQPFVDAAAQIQKIPDGRVSAVFWDLADLNDSQTQALVSCGFNELVVDGHNFSEGSLPIDFVAQRVIGAQKAGIRSFKFVRGSPDWSTTKRHDAIRRMTKMADKILELKNELRIRQEPAAAEIVKGILLNVEVYADRSWNYDLAPYTNLHRKLESLVLSKGLTYESFEAFWISDERHESGYAMTGFELSSPRTVYIMSYRKDGYETYRVASRFAVSSPHVAGFDLVSGSLVGYRDDPASLAQSVAEYVEAMSHSGDRPGFKGIFVHASHARDIVAFARAAYRLRGPSRD
jgi:hypothetical protein